MPVLLAPYYRLARNPVELNDPAWAGKRSVTVSRIIAAAKRQQRAFGWRHFENDVFQIRPGSQQAKLDARRFPSRIHVNKNSDDLCLGIGVDLTIFLATTAANGDHVRAISQIDVKFCLERFAKLLAAHLLDQLRKRRAISHLSKVKATRPGNLGIILIDCSARLSLYKLWNNKELKRFTGERRGAKSLEIKHRNHTARLHKNSGTARWNRLPESDAH